MLEKVDDQRWTESDNPFVYRSRSRLPKISDIGLVFCKYTSPTAVWVLPVFVRMTARSYRMGQAFRILAYFWHADCSRMLDMCITGGLSVLECPVDQVGEPIDELVAWPTSDSNYHTRFPRTWHTPHWQYVNHSDYDCNGRKRQDGLRLFDQNKPCKRKQKDQFRRRRTITYLIRKEPFEDIISK